MPPPVMVPLVPVTGSGAAAIRLQQTYSAVSRAQAENPAGAGAAAFDYYEAVQRYHAGDILGSLNAATRAQALAGQTGPGPSQAQLNPPVLQPIGAGPFPPNAFQFPSQRFGVTPGPGLLAPAPLLAENPLDSLLALVKRDIGVAKTRVNTTAAESAYEHALARRRAGDDAGAIREAQRALETVRQELTH